MQVKYYVIGLTGNNNSVVGSWKSPLGHLQRCPFCMCGEYLIADNPCLLSPYTGEEERRQREQLEGHIRELQEDKNSLEAEVQRLQEKLAQIPRVVHH